VDRTTLSYETDNSPDPPASPVEDDLGPAARSRAAETSESIILLTSEESSVKCPTIETALSKEATVDAILDSCSEVNLLTEGFTMIYLIAAGIEVLTLLLENVARFSHRFRKRTNIKKHGLIRTDFRQ
jgi:hypothetical protein